MPGAEHAPGRVRPLGQPLLKAHGETSGSGQQGSTFSRDFSRMYSYVGQGFNSSADLPTRVDKMGSVLHRMWYNFDGLKETKASAVTTLTILLAYKALTFRYHTWAARQELEIQEYNEYQTKNAQRGEVVRGIEIHEGEEKQTLAWVLDQVDISHDLGEGDICIPFTPMEQQMRQVALALGINEYIYTDHEKRSDPRRLMQEWLNKDQTE